MAAQLKMVDGQVAIVPGFEEGEKTRDRRSMGPDTEQQTMSGLTGGVAGLLGRLKKTPESENNDFVISLDTKDISTDPPLILKIGDNNYMVMFGDEIRGFASRKEAEEFKDRISGRGGFQTGGITETRNLPPEYVEALGKTYAADLTRQAVYLVLLQQQLNNQVRLQNSLHKDKHKHNSLELQKLVWLNLHRKLQRKMHYKQQHIHKQQIHQQDLVLINLF